MRKRSLKAQLSITIAMVVLVTVSLISILSNLFVNQKFKDYITRQQVEKTQEIVSKLSHQYNGMQRIWNKESVHTIGMYALYDGYIIKIYDNKGESVWDAERHDMTLCTQVMAEISERMQEKYPRMSGEFMSEDFSLTQNGTVIGSVTITYYGPYFLSESDFQFLNTLNSVLIGIGTFSMLFSLIIGWAMANRISRPITKIIKIAQEISEGNYKIRFEGLTRTTEVNALILSINNLASSLNEQEGLRKRLTADVAHELRTPLTTVSTHLEAMIEGVWEPTEERLRSCHEEIDRITKLVKDLEHLAKVESDNFRLHKIQFNLLEIVNIICSNLEIEIRNKKLDLVIEGKSFYITADRNRICQVVLNLVSNAIKYTPMNGQIKVSLAETEQSIVIEVIDNGDGISPEEMPFIFERFYRADKSRNRKTGGAGIGLAVVKSIVDAHGGMIEAESHVGRGSTFKVTLPKSDYEP